MKPLIQLKVKATIAVIALSTNAFAYEDGKKKELCRPPKIQEFTLPVYSESNKVEAQPESEFSFVVSGWANPKKFKLTGKDKNIPFTVKSTETFHKITAKLIPEFSGQAVRISARIPAILDCYSTMGWLVKVAEKATAPAAVAPVKAPAEATPSTSTGSTTSSGQAKPVSSAPQAAPAKTVPTTEVPPSKPAE